MAKITTTTTHELLFAVEAFWSEEGGMGQDQFGDSVHSLEEALHLLELAKASKRTQVARDWVITINVESKTTKA